MTIPTQGPRQKRLVAQFLYFVHYKSMFLSLDGPSSFFHHGPMEDQWITYFSLVVFFKVCKPVSGVGAMCIIFRRERVRYNRNAYVNELGISGQESRGRSQN